MALRRAPVPLLLACVLLLPAALRAQIASGEITGLVTDATGAALPGVTVIVVDTATNRQWVVTTSADGVYAAPGLAPGRYRLTAELSGFTPAARDGVHVTTGEKAAVDFRLTVGSVATEVTVTADAPMLRAETASLGTVVQHEQVVQLPLNGRTFITLAGAGAGRRAAAELAAAADQRRPAAHERIPLRRHLGAAAGAGAGGVLPGHRRDPGVQDREQQPAGRVRPLQRRRRQPDDQVGTERVPRRRLRVPAQRGAERAQLLPVDRTR